MTSFPKQSCSPRSQDRDTRNQKKYAKRFIFAPVGGSSALLVVNKFCRVALAIYKLLFSGQS
jgi:hypothetical protein